MKTAQGVTLIANGQLVDGNGGAPVPDAVVVARDGRITYAGPVKGAPEVPPEARRMTARVKNPVGAGRRLLHQSKLSRPELPRRCRAGKARRSDLPRRDDPARHS